MNPISKGWTCLIFFMFLWATPPAGLACDPHGLTGFFPENDLYFPIGLTNNGVTEEQFQDVIEGIRDVYGPIFTDMGWDLEVTGDWSNGTVNAYAYPGLFGTSHVVLLGGLARHPMMNQMALLMVACHEVGHHIAGKPFYSFALWNASVEGQADIFAATFCTKRVAQAMGISHEEDLADAPTNDVTFFQNSCQGPHPELCQSVSLAGRDLANVLGHLSGSGLVDIRSYDSQQVESTRSGHPEAQCRFDTYFAGAQCSLDHLRLPEDDGRHTTYCENSRPLCWFSPSSPSSDDDDDWWWWPWLTGHAREGA